ncbi:hypothetical protein ACET3X_001713 [Alternaria dauci]|uniref:Uncharacterized protein n=1 Tax=Alternaria dauci TaxID=48095 RepID=A0ABR3UY27_9PLEO
MNDKLREAHQRIRELNRNKFDAEDTIARLRDAARIRREEVMKKDTKIARDEAAYRALLKDFTDVERGYNRILERLVKPYAVMRKIDYHGLTDESIKTVIDSMLQEATQHKTLRAENCCLKVQVQELQQDMLAKVDKVDAISDDQFAKDFRSLASTIKSFSRSLRFTDQADLVGYLGSLVLVQDVASHHWGIRARKKPLVEAWIWSVLIDLGFKSPYAIFGDHCQAVHHAWLQIYGAGQLDSWPIPSSHSETWRVKTVEQLYEQTRPETVAGDKSGLLPKGLTASMVGVRDFATTVISSHFDILSPGYKLADVHLIVDKAFALAMDMFLQRSRLQVTYPAIGAEFNETSMSSVEDDEDQDMEVGVVALIINPGLTKWGDVHGEHYDQFYDIVPSLVQLEPKDSGHDLQEGYQRGVKAESGIKQDAGVEEESQWTC